MLEIDTIGNDATQETILTVLDDEIIIKLRFLAAVQSWVMDVSYQDYNRYSIRMVVGAPLLLSRDFPFDFLVYDASQIGEDPFRLVDFSSGRCRLFYLDEDEIVQFRGF